jgi:hypothetical protein
MITVNIQGHGSYVIRSDKLDELLQWISTNSMPVESSNRPLGADETLLNE